MTLTLATIVILLGVPFFLFTPSELAPKEDQGVILGIVQAAPNSTIEQTTLYTEKVNEAFLSIPETRHTFQFTQPFIGFSGMGVKPWSQRTRSTEQILPEVFGKVAAIPGVRVIATTPAPLPGGGQFPVEFVITTTAEPRELLDFANQLVAKAMSKRHLCLRGHRSEVRHAADRDRLRSRQGGVARAEPAASRRRSRARCSAEITSTASASRGAATRSFRRSSERNVSIPIS